MFSVMYPPVKQDYNQNKNNMMRNTSVKIWMITMDHANGIVEDCIDYLAEHTILQGSGPKQRIYPCIMINVDIYDI